MLRVMTADAPTRLSEEQTRRRLAEAPTLVVKVGTNALSRADDSLNVDRVRSLANELADLRDAGRRVVLVSSGAVGAGMDVLGLSKRPVDLPRLQASAAAGQAKLIGLYDEALQKRGTHAAQILVTGNDFKQRARYLNARNTLHALFDFGVIPIVNENDSVSVAEIRFGDNDRLAALVAGLFDNAAVIVLTAVEGLLDGPPDEPTSRRVPFVSNVDQTARGHATDVRSSRGSGGMTAKLDAVRTAAETGAAVAIADGREAGVLSRVAAGEDVGTAFAPAGTSLPAWKRWIAHAAAEGGTLTLDDGAAAAVANDGRSLLPVGGTNVTGSFQPGDLVRLTTPDGREVGRGLTNYSSEDARRIAGRSSDQLAEAVGDRPYLEMVHRDNLVLVQP